MSKQLEIRDSDLRLREEIKTLCAELRLTGQLLTKRRESGKRLLHILSKERNRIRMVELYVEQSVANGYSLAKARKRAHQLAWTPIIKSAFYSAQNITKKKSTKLNPDDIKLPLKILHYSDMSSESGRVRVECTSRLTPEDVAQVLIFCLHMLEKDDVRRVAETELLNTMVYLAERVDYVADFDPNNEIPKILSTAEVALNAEYGQNSVAAARLFASILESCVELGMGLFAHVNKSVKIVAKWCKAHSEDAEKGSREFAHLLRGVAAVIRFHPEQAIKPIVRYGRSLLGFAKKTYLKANKETRHAIHGYLIGHL